MFSRGNRVEKYLGEETRRAGVDVMRFGNRPGNGVLLLRCERKVSYGDGVGGHMRGGVMEWCSGGVI
jgi:hypothetical protein